MAEMRESNKLGKLTVKVDVDVSDALKGLKALRREANKTLKVLEEIDKHKKIVLGNMIDNKHTQGIVSEMIRERLSK
jgi:D-serine deaminase-like pyridoxal phosphate-dependent protein